MAGFVVSLIASSIVSIPIEDKVGTYFRRDLYRRRHNVSIPIEDKVEQHFVDFFIIITKCSSVKLR